MRLEAPARNHRAMRGVPEHTRQARFRYHAIWNN